MLKRKKVKEMKKQKENQKLFKCFCCNQYFESILRLNEHLLLFHELIFDKYEVYK